MKPSEQTTRDWEEPKEALLRGIVSRILQLLARNLPGARTTRVLLHRARGVRIGRGVWIGYDVVLDTAQPHLISIEDGATISIGALLVAHFKEFRGIRIEQDAFIGPRAIILPNVVIGRGAVVKAGSVVSQSVPPMTVVQGNPAVAVAQCTIALQQDVSLKSFSRGLRPPKGRNSRRTPSAESGASVPIEAKSAPSGSLSRRTRIDESPVSQRH
jgi:serine acetyltransferase